MFSLMLLMVLAQPAAPGTPRPDTIPLPDRAELGVAPLQGLAAIDARGNLTFVSSKIRCGYGRMDGEVELGTPANKDKATIATMVLTVVELPAKYVEAYTVAGQPIPAAKLADLLRPERTVLFALDGKKVDPFHLTFCKADTIILVPQANLWGGKDELLPVSPSKKQPTGKPPASQQGSEKAPDVPPRKDAHDSGDKKASAAATVAALVWSPDGKTLASGSWDFTVRLWQPASGQLLRTFPGQALRWVHAVAWSPDGKALAYGNYNDPVYLWETRSARLLRTLPADGILCLAWSPDAGQLVTSGWGGSVRLWEVASGRTPRAWQLSEGDAGRVAWSPDGKVVAAGDSNARVRLWDASSGQLLRTLEGHEPGGWGIQALAWSPDSKRLASGGADKTVRLWDADSGKLLRTFRGHKDGVHALAWSPVGRVVASGDGDGTLLLWEADSGQILHRITELREPVGALAWSPDGKRCVVGAGWGDLRIWDAASGQLLRKQAGHTTPLKSVSWSPDGSAVASVGEDGTVRVWEAESGRTRAVLRTLPKGGYVAISANGHYRGSPGIERDLVYVVQTEQGQETLSPEEFSRRCGWKNDPGHVHLTGE